MRRPTWPRPPARAPLDYELKLAVRFRGQFSTTSLTLLSIIQGVALALLASVVSGNYTHFTLLQDLMAATSFFLIILVWHHMSVDFLAFSWLPTFFDSAVPFIVGVAELYIIEAVVIGVEAWMLGAVFVVLAAMLELTYVRIRAEASHTSDDEVLQFLRIRWRAQIVLNLVGLVVFPIFVAGALTHVITDTVGDARAPLTVAAILVVLSWLVAYMATGHFALRTTLKVRRG